MLRASGIGSLPCRSLDEAFALVECDERMIPYVPELPLAGIRSTMLYAPFEVFGEKALAELFPNPKSNRVVVRRSSLDRLVGLCESIDSAEGAESGSRAGDAFSRAVAEFRGRTKHLLAGVVGPATLLGSLFIEQENRLVSAASSAAVRDAIVSLLERGIHARLRVAREAGLTAILHLDEPALPYLDASIRADAEDALRILLQRLDGEGVVGVHCCGSVAKRELELLQSLKLRLISLPVAPSRSREFEELVKPLLRTGCWVLPGVVRTDGSAQPEVAEVRGMLAHWMSLSAEGNLVITPDCGLGLLGETETKRVLNELRGLLA